MPQKTTFSRKQFNKTVNTISNAMDRALDRADAAATNAEADRFLDAHDALEVQLNRVFDLRDDYLRSTRATGEAEARLAEGAEAARTLLARLRRAESFLNAAAKLADKITEFAAFLRQV